MHQKIKNLIESKVLICWPGDEEEIDDNIGEKKNKVFPKKIQKQSFRTHVIAPSENEIFLGTICVSLVKIQNRFISLADDVGRHHHFAKEIGAFLLYF